MWMLQHTRPADSESLEAAKVAGLRYVSDRGPGIRRIRCGKGFRYVDAHSQAVRDREELQRIRALAIPPAWSNVWICPTRLGHIQAVGWDAKGRKQYRYHVGYRAVRDRDKFSRMHAFGRVLPLIRRRVARDLRRPGLPREKVLAAVVRLLETTFVRVGNDEYARENGSFGLTTLRNRHLRVKGEILKFDFKGKSGVRHFIELRDRSLSRVILECQELPGYRLFQYVDGDGEVCDVDSGDVNDYLRSITGEEFSAKDFRTWAGTVLASHELTTAGLQRNQKDCKHKIVGALQRVARSLGNRPATCRKYYVHPAVIDAYSDGSLFELMQPDRIQQAASNGRGLSAEESSVLVLIGKSIKRPHRNGKQMRLVSKVRPAVAA